MVCVTDRFCSFSDDFRKSEAGRNAAQLIQLREAYNSVDPAELWREFGVIRRENAGRYSVLTSELDNETDVVFCFHDEGESAADAECYGFAQLACMTGLTTVCTEKTDCTDIPGILAELKAAGVACHRVFAFGKGAGGAAAVQCASAYPTLLDGVCAAFVGRTLCEMNFAEVDSSIRKVPVMLIGGTEDGSSSCGKNKDGLSDLMQKVSGVETDQTCIKVNSTVERALGINVHKGYYVMIEGTIWMVADWCNKERSLAFRIMEGLDVPRIMTGAIAPLAYRFFSGR